MQRLIVVYNPNSSRFADVKKTVLDKTKSLKGFQVGRFEIQQTDLTTNVKNLSKILKDEDLVISAGGDATGIISANGILESGKNVTLAVLPYGNFNDLSRTLHTKHFDDIFTGKAKKCKLHPLEIIVDNKFFRYATCYVTIGMTAEAVKIYDYPKMRKKLKKNFGRAISSYTDLMKWYFKNRHTKQFLSQFRLNGVLQNPKMSDYIAVNGSSMARILKCGKNYRNKKIFCSRVDQLVNFWKLFKLLIRSFIYRIPGKETTGDIIEFETPTTVEIQAEGEYGVFKDAKKIEVRKGEKCLRVIKI